MGSRDDYGESSIRCLAKVVPLHVFLLMMVITTLILMMVMVMILFVADDDNVEVLCFVFVFIIHHSIHEVFCFHDACHNGFVIAAVISLVLSRLHASRR